MRLRLCRMEIVGEGERPGWHRYKCTGRGCRKKAHSPFDPDRIWKTCRRYPTLADFVAAIIARSLPGPGTCLAAVIYWVTGAEADSTCQCAAQRELMDQIGWRESWWRRQVFVDEICEQASKLGKPCPARSVGGLVMAAVMEWWSAGIAVPPTRPAP